MTELKPPVTQLIQEAYAVEGCLSRTEEERDAAKRELEELREAVRDAVPEQTPLCNRLMLSRDHAERLRTLVYGESPTPTLTRLVPDLIRDAMHKAAESFGGGDGTFNSAGFGLALHKLIYGKERGIDGKLVSAILISRNDVDQLMGGAHWQIRDYQRPTPTLTVDGIELEQVDANLWSGNRDDGGFVEVVKNTYPPLWVARIAWDGEDLETTQGHPTAQAAADALTKRLRSLRGES